MHNAFHKEINVIQMNRTLPVDPFGNGSRSTLRAKLLYTILGVGLWASLYMKGGKKFHMVGLAAMCWGLWKARTDICFENKTNQISYKDYMCN